MFVCYVDALEVLDWFADQKVDWVLISYMNVNFLWVDEICGFY